MTRARDIADQQDNSGGAVAPFVAGKNKIINGDFGIWQRGTSFSSGGFTSDRWLLQIDGSGATRAITQQTFTPGAAPVVGYEGQYFFRYNQSVAGTSATYNVLDSRIEDVRVLAGQIVTVSFWAKAAAATSISSSIQQVFGTGGSAEVAGLSTSTFTLTTSWVRYSYTGTLASISGKTIGTGSYAALRFNFPLNATFTIDIWGVQLEAGSAHTPFTTASGSIGGELALCQRYYQLGGNGSTGSVWGSSFGTAGSNLDMHIKMYPPMRVSPSISLTAATNNVYSSGNAPVTFTPSGTFGVTASHVGYTGSVTTSVSGVTFYINGDIVALNSEL
jgi:hypothetical protein